MTETIPPYWSTSLATIHKRVGNPDTEEEFLKSRSPLFKVEKIKIPILIAQGANDPRVKQAESEQIVEAIKKKALNTNTCSSLMRVMDLPNQKTVSNSTQPQRSSLRSTWAGVTRVLHNLTVWDIDPFGWNLPYAAKIQPNTYQTMTSGEPHLHHNPPNPD